jgi:glutathione synthase/RimK-type ligase-like ATP-grasp enzyme
VNLALPVATQAPILRAEPVERARLWDALAVTMANDAAFAALRDGRMGLIAPYVLEIRPEELRAIREFVRVFADVTAHPAIRERAIALSRARNLPAGGPHPWILSLDFHLAPAGPKLIEVNTNPGGLMIAAAHALAAGVMSAAEKAGLERRIVDAFRNEWARAGRGNPLTCIAIVDNDPVNQFLYPEFVLYRDLLDRHGIETLICDPGELRVAEGALMHGNRQIDLVYNRLTDFHFEEPRHAVLAQAWRSAMTVVTPDPAAYAACADKRLMSLLCDRDALTRHGVPESAANAISAGVPRTILPEESNADELWSARRALFFKPARGHAGKAAYRGDKISRATWERLDLETYVAQDFVPAPRVQVAAYGTLKADVRVFVRGSDIIFMCARLYEGQTTNFRTPGGGFASVRATDGRSLPCD